MSNLQQSLSPAPSWPRALALVVALSASAVGLSQLQVNAHDRCVIVALPGAQAADIEQMVAAGHLPVLGSLGSRAVVAVVAPQRSSRVSGRWARASALKQLATFDGEGKRDEAETERRFVGGSGFAPVLARAVATHRLPWPHLQAANAVAVSAENLAVGEWSKWIDVDVADGRAATFQIGRINRARYLLSPAFVRTETRHWSAPTILLSPDEESAALVYRFVRDRLPSVTSENPKEAGASSVLVEPLVAAARAAAGDSSALVEQAYRDVDARIGELLESQGDVSLAVVVLGSEAGPWLRPSTHEAWAWFVGPSTASAYIVLEPDDLEAAVLYVSGSHGATVPPSSLRARFRPRASMASVQLVVDESDLVAFEASTLVAENLVGDDAPMIIDDDRSK
ncbi:MAG: hypothetical protein ACI8TX_002290 [Hyphomicrobiaceae bacterium]|jgi:hypothetical protein